MTDAEMLYRYVRRFGYAEWRIEREGDEYVLYIGPLGAGDMRTTTAGSRREAMAQFAAQARRDLKQADAYWSSPERSWNR